MFEGACEMDQPLLRDSRLQSPLCPFPMAVLKLQNVSKKFGQTEVIHGVSLEVEDGEFVVFVGPSGCGKTTLLRMIAGLEELTDGEISIGNRIVNDIDPANRGVAMVFQNYALYPHMSVEENMAFGLRMAKRPKKEIKEKVQRAAEILQLSPYLKRRPKALSGGQRQRVAIGRAIVRDPALFLFDEPLSNLDAELRVQMRIELAKLHSELEATMVYVTHDQVEAMTLADKIVLINEGRIEQIGVPMDLYHFPKNLFVAGFIGAPRMNFIAANVVGINGERISVASTDFPGHIFEFERANLPAYAKGAALTLGVRPENVFVTEPDDCAGTLKIEVVENLGDLTFLHAKSPAGNRVTLNVKGFFGYRHGDAIPVDFEPKHGHLFGGDGQRI
jgi:ABC-type sugar transport system ATPase subunit